MRALFLIVILAGVLFVGGCATDSQPKDPDRVSSIPWNRPQTWEGQGPLGGMMSQGGGY
jgi:hypothetical protein